MTFITYEITCKFPIFDFPKQCSYQILLVDHTELWRWVQVQHPHLIIIIIIIICFGWFQAPQTQVSPLITSLTLVGYHQNPLLKLPNSVKLKSPTRPDSVLSLFKSFDISKPHISKLITMYPKVLLAHPTKTLKPKLQFFSRIGMSGPIMGKFLSCQCKCLLSSLDNQIVPCINFFRRIVHTNTNVLKILNRFKWAFRDVERKMQPNITLLRKHGVPECYISKLLLANPVNLLIKPDRFHKVVLELDKMGVTHSNNMFPHCLNVRLSMKKSTWDAKLAVYKSLGWSEDEVISMFKRQPYTMGMSEKKMKLAINFLANNLNWTRADIAKYITVLTLSFEKRVIPRTYVLQILQSKNLINGISIGAALKDTEDVFLKKFVIKYSHEVPNLLKLYQSKMSTQSSLVGSATEKM